PRPRRIRRIRRIVGADLKTNDPQAIAPNNTQAVTLGVQGMTCAACQAHVERALRETEGVTSASVNLMTHSARVVY
ncbi:MAG: cation transporter, partial [Acetobacteraceae bacterium]